MQTLDLTSRYRERGEIEKGFKALKNEFDIHPLNTHSEKQQEDSFSSRS